MRGIDVNFKKLAFSAIIITKRRRKPMTALRLMWVKKYMNDSFQLHLKMVEMALEQGVTATVAAFSTTRKTVYKG